MKAKEIRVITDGKQTAIYPSIETAVIHLGAEYGALTYNRMYDRGRIHIKGNTIKITTEESMEAQHHLGFITDFKC